MHYLNRRQLEREGRKEPGTSGRAWPRASCCDSHKACPVCVRAEKAGERGRVADKCWEGGTLNTHS